MQEGLVSIVVPVYKTEKYLEQCIESIVNQTYRNLDIILVDDGSPDGCPQICDAWVERDHRIRVIHKENGGLSSARNIGIDEANGEYICFFDSDDYIDQNTIERAYALGKKETADIVIFGFSVINNRGEIVGQRVPLIEKIVYKEEDVQHEFLPMLIGKDAHTQKKCNLYMSAWTSMFSMDVIQRAGWRFVSERIIISEDVYSLLKLYKHIQKVAVLKESLYFYRENDTSVTRTYRSDRFQKVKFFYEKCVELCQECRYSDSVAHRCAEPFIAFTIAALKQEVMYHKTMKASLSRVKMIIDDDILRQVLQKKKKDNVGIMRKVLFWSMRNKMYRLCYILVAVKNKM